MAARKKTSRRKSKATASRGASTLKRFILWAVGLTALFAGLIAIGGYLYFSHGLPDYRNLSDYRPPETSRILASDGTVLSELYRYRRTVVGREQIPDVVIHAVLAAEDADFYTHEGLDYVGMLRALYNSMKAGRVTGSGSTITQQTVKNLLLTPERSLRRKARELILARRLETHLSKDDILTIYLNAIYLGHGRYGIQEAAQFYFGRDAEDLELNHAAIIAGLIQSPERISPRKHPKRSKQRRAYVLRQMVDKGFLKQSEADATRKMGLDLRKAAKKTAKHRAGWFVDAVRKRLVEYYGEDRVLEGGLYVHTSLDIEHQIAAADAVAEGLGALEKRQEQYGKAKPEAAFAVIDNRSREILAMVGGRDHKKSPFNRVSQARRQPGSAFKPFVWASALESEAYTTASMLMDAPETVRQHQGKLWQPRNYTKKFRGLVSLRSGLAQSVNSIAVSLADQVGVDAIKSMARRAGIRSNMAPGLAMALGASEVSPLELLNAYASFVEPAPQEEIIMIRRVDSRDGVEYPEKKTVNKRRALSPELRFLVRSMLRSVVTDGTGRRLKSLEHPIGGKTGTTNAARDAWFVGILPAVSMVSWVGFDDGKPLGRGESGGRTAVPIVKTYLEKSKLVVEEWPEPPEGIVAHEVVADGRLAPESVLDKRVEFFIDGTEPREWAPAPDEVDEDGFHLEGMGEAEAIRPVPQTNGPGIKVPSVNVMPLPPDLKPIMPKQMEGVPDDDSDHQDEDRPL